MEEMYAMLNNGNRLAIQFKSARISVGGHYISHCSWKCCKCTWGGGGVVGVCTPSSRHRPKFLVIFFRISACVRIVWCCVS